MAEPRPAVRGLIWSWLLFVAVETATQVTLKFAGATLDDRGGLLALAAHALMTPVVLLGFVLYFCGFLVWITILKDVDVGRGFPMTASVYLATVALAVLVFHETLSPMRIVGVVVINAGVLLMASDEDSPGGG